MSKKELKKELAKAQNTVRYINTDDRKQFRAYREMLINIRLLRLSLAC